MCGSQHQLEESGYVHPSHYHPRCSQGCLIPPFGCNREEVSPEWDADGEGAHHCPPYPWEPERTQKGEKAPHPKEETYSHPLQSPKDHLTNYDGSHATHQRPDH